MDFKKVLELRKWCAIVCIVALATGFTACDKENKGKEDVQISIANPSELNQTANANDVSTQGFTFTAKSNWTASVKEANSSKSSDVAWIRLLNDGMETYSGVAGTFAMVISLDVNTTGVVRSATIEIVCGSDKITVMVTQAGTSGGGGGGGDVAEWIAVANSGFDSYEDIRGITYGGGTFIAVGDHGKISTSTDGINWNAVTPLEYQRTLKSIAYGDGTFIVTHSNDVSYSTDNGQTWTDVEDVFAEGGWTSPSIRDIAYGGGTFVAVGDNGRIAYSSNGGRNWTEVANSTFGDTKINSVAFGNNTFVAVGHTGKAAYSTNNGATWTAVANSTFGSDECGDYNIFGIGYGNGTFVMAGMNGKTAYSTNGTSWTAANATSTTATSTLNGIAFGANTFVAVGDLGTIVRSTDNGKNWGGKETHPLYYLTEFKDVAFGNNTFVAVAGKIIYSKVK